MTTAVDNCLIHSSATACSTCESTHFLTGSACEKITTITGCSEYSAKDKCKTCSGKYFLENENCTDSGITGCVKPAKNGETFTCDECEAIRYLDAEKKNCTSGSGISGCVAYETATKCTKCGADKILNADGSKCTSITSVNEAGANCSVGSTLTDPACDVCKLGFKKKSDGTCEAITLANCVVESADNKCLLCMPDSSMDKDGKCTANTRPPTPCVGDDCSTTIFKMSLSLFLAFFLIRFFSES